MDALPEPYNLMVLVCGCLGLRVSETLGLKWVDFDFDKGTLAIVQVFTHGAVQHVPKTDTSDNEVPVHPRLCEALEERAKTRLCMGVRKPQDGKPILGFHYPHALSQARSCEGRHNRPRVAHLPAFV